MQWTTYDSPLGRLTLLGDDGVLRRLAFAGQAGVLPAADERPGGFAEARRQLDGYFAGERRSFDLPLELEGTAFQREVWARLREVPCGATTTYAEIAAAIGRPRSVRAVGAAVGRTPVPIVVPCHRVLGSDGTLTGYLGGLEAKRALLELERSGAPAAA